jgi:hypothetical protein
MTALVIAPPKIMKTSITRSFELKKKCSMFQFENEKKKRVSDDVKFRKDFDEGSKMIPSSRGSVVIIGFKGEESQVIEFVQTEGSLRTKFKGGIVIKNGVSMTRYKWYKSLLFNNEYSSLKIQMVS